jgi:hypothetical protein
MELKDEFPCSKGPATGPYPKPNVSTSNLTPYFFYMHLNINTPHGLPPTSIPTSRLFRMNFIPFTAPNAQDTKPTHVKTGRKAEETNTSRHLLVLE